VVIVATRMLRDSGADLLGLIEQTSPATSVLAIAAEGDGTEAIRAQARAAYSYPNQTDGPRGGPRRGARRPLATTNLEGCP
jgi:hypothetical protein